MIAIPLAFLLLDVGVGVWAAATNHDMAAAVSVVGAAIWGYSVGREAAPRLTNHEEPR